MRRRGGDDKKTKKRQNKKEDEGFRGKKMLETEGQFGLKKRWRRKKERRTWRIKWGSGDGEA